MTRRNKFILTLFYILVANSLFSQLKFYVSTDSDKIPVKTYFNIQFIIENGEPENFTPPKFNGLKLISGPNRSSTYSNVNGKVTSKEEYVYNFFAEKTGKFTIEPATVSVNGKKYSTKRLEINIIAGNTQNLSNYNEDNDYFVRAEIDKKNLIVGEQLTVKYNLYRRIDISNFEVEKLPEFKGFNTFEIKNNFNSQRIEIKGKTYIVNTLLAFAIWPKVEGDITIEPLKLKLLLPDPKNRNPFFRSEIPKHISSNEINLKIDRIPDTDFSGLVGNTILEANVEAEDIEIGDAFPLKVQIESEAELIGIMAPDLKGKFQGFEVYDPKLLSENSNFENGKLISSKSFEYLLVPLEKGEKRIEFSIDCYDTEHNEKKTIAIEPINLQIDENPDFHNDSKKDKVEDLLPLMKITEFTVVNNIEKYKNYMIITVCIFFLIFIGLFLLKLWLNKKSKLSPILIKQKKAEAMAMKRLKIAKKYMLENESSNFYKEISTALNKYMLEKYNISEIDLTRTNLKRIFEERKLNLKMISSFFKTLDECENFIYGRLESRSMQEVFNDSVELIKSLENS